MGLVEGPAAGGADCGTELGGRKWIWPLPSVNGRGPLGSRGLYHKRGLSWLGSAICGAVAVDGLEARGKVLGTAVALVRIEEDAG